MLDEYVLLIEEHNTEDFKTGKLMAAGLFFMDKVNYGFSTAYNKKLLTVLAELYGAKKAATYLRFYWADKLLISFISFCMGLLFCIFAKMGPESIIFCFAFAASVFYLMDGDLYKRAKKRRDEIKRDFPVFVNKLVLLINAGMTITESWEKSAIEGRKDSPLYTELLISLYDIRSGLPESKAYENFAKRCRVAEITRFVSLIIQNIKKGNDELVPLLRLFANECWDMRKNVARKYAEEASTKLVFPMMLMFIAILLIVTTPAALALRGI